MRRSVTVDKLKEFIRRLGRGATGPGSVYLTGGSTALLLGLREQTIDIDLKLDPEPPGAFEAIAALKNELDINVELAAPDDFIPAPSDWRNKSRYIDTVNGVIFYHYDLDVQALSKIERGHEQDLRDVAALLERGLVTRESILQTFRKIQPFLLRYPAIDAAQFEQKVLDIIRKQDNEGT